MAVAIYVETTIPKAYAATRATQGSSERRDATRRWWAQCAGRCELLASEATLAELEAWQDPGQRSALELLRPLPVLTVTDEALAIARLYQRHAHIEGPLTRGRLHVVLAGLPDASLHLALASLARVEFFLTWRTRGYAALDTLSYLTALNRRLSLRMPRIISPDASGPSAA